MSKHTGDNIPRELSFASSILESISDGVFTIDLEWKITTFNRAAEKITGIKREEAIGKRCSDVFRSSMCEHGCALKQTILSEKPVIDKTCFIINASGERIPISVSTAVLKDENGNVVGGAETFRDLSELESLRKEIEGSFRIGELVSHSPLMRKIFEIIPAVAESMSTVLIQGETGTGKEVIARTIHSLSKRSGKPFVAVNCAALPDTLLESELFGYRAGAFTGANKDKPGRFQTAKGGTLFLDELGCISPPLQVKLLRVLQDGVFEPLGSNTPEKSNARIITATNSDLMKAVEEGTFREDLYYRVNVIRIELPPLRNRKEDIPLLSETMIRRFNSIQSAEVTGLAPDVLSIFMAHNWPGNIRELENIIERAFVLCREGLISVNHLPEELINIAAPEKSPHGIKRTTGMLEAQIIRSALERNNYNREAAAAELGIHKTTFYRKIKKLGLDLPEKDGRSR